MTRSEVLKKVIIGQDVRVIGTGADLYDGIVTIIDDIYIHLKSDNDGFTYQIEFDDIVDILGRPVLHEEKPSITRDDILDKAKSIINGERQGTYGAAEDSFAIIAQFWSAYLGKEVSSADVANMMILLKVARNHSGVYKDDNWIDMCGYAALGGEIQAQKNE